MSYGFLLVRERDIVDVDVAHPRPVTYCQPMRPSSSDVTKYSSLHALFPGGGHLTQFRPRIRRSWPLRSSARKNPRRLPRSVRIARDILPSRAMPSDSPLNRGAARPLRRVLTRNARSFFEPSGFDQETLRSRKRLSVRPTAPLDLGRNGAFLPRPRVCGREPRVSSTPITPSAGNGGSKAPRRARRSQVACLGRAPSATERPRFSTLASSSTR
jgi:hypothetical protein